MWRKGNPFALLVGMQVGTATVESSMEISQKIKNAPAGMAQLIEHWACEPKGHRLDSQSGHMPGLWTRHPVGGA